MFLVSNFTKTHGVKAASRDATLGSSSAGERRQKGNLVRDTSNLVLISYLRWNIDGWSVLGIARRARPFDVILRRKRVKAKCFGEGTAFGQRGRTSTAQTFTSSKASFNIASFEHVRQPEPDL